MNLSTVASIKAETATVKARQRCGYATDSGTAIATVTAQIKDWVGRATAPHHAVNLSRCHERFKAACAAHKAACAANAALGARCESEKRAGFTVEWRSGAKAAALQAAFDKTRTAFDEVVAAGAAIDAQKQTRLTELDDLEAKCVAARALLEELEAEARGFNEALKQAGCTRAQWPEHCARMTREFLARVDPLVKDPARRRVLGLPT